VRNAPHGLVADTESAAVNGAPILGPISAGFSDNGYNLDICSIISHIKGVIAKTVLLCQ